MLGNPFLWGSQYINESASNVGCGEPVVCMGEPHRSRAFATDGVRLAHHHPTLAPS